MIWLKQKFEIDLSFTDRSIFLFPENEKLFSKYRERAKIFSIVLKI